MELIASLGSLYVQSPPGQTSRMDVVHVCAQWDDRNDVDVPPRRGIPREEEISRVRGCPKGQPPGFFFDWPKRWDENPCSRVRDSEIFAVRRIILELWILAVPASLVFLSSNNRNTLFAYRGSSHFPAIGFFAIWRFLDVSPSPPF